VAAETHNPLEQFTVSPLLKLPSVYGIDATLTNSALFMLLSVVAITLFYMIAMRKRAQVPGRLQSIAEIFYQFVHGIVEENTGHTGMKYFPFILSLFLFILFMNLLGLIPFAFTPTSHVIVTFGMGAFVFIAITLIGIIKKGPIGFFKHFIPEGLPLVLIPVLLLIELVSYMARPFSLAIRLMANMAAGHTLMQVIGGFVVPLGLFGVLPIAFLVFMTGLEFFVAMLQAYIFTLLSCMYLGEALADDHH
jgi:F-type H+-transporting ATPase subunit a